MSDVEEYSDVEISDVETEDGEQEGYEEVDRGEEEDVEDDEESVRTIVKDVLDSLLKYKKDIIESKTNGTEDMDIVLSIEGILRRDSRASPLGGATDSARVGTFGAELGVVAGAGL